MGTLHKYLWKFVIISRSILLKKRNVSDKNFRENQDTHFIFRNFFRKSCRLWNNLEKNGKAKQVTDSNMMKCMRFAYWIGNSTGTHMENVVLIAFL
jgi:hypothetical protein